MNSSRETEPLRSASAAVNMAFKLVSFFPKSERLLPDPRSSHTAGAHPILRNKEVLVQADETLFSEAEIAKDL